MQVVRAKGYSATTVDELCAAAGVTKGAFFHHFSSKQDLAIEAARHFAAMAERLFTAVPYLALPDPVERLLAYVELRKALLRGELPEFTCLLGTMVQEAYQTHPEIRAACEECLGEHLTMLEADIAEAQQRSGHSGQWSPASLAAYMQAVIQGAFVLAKAQQGSAVAMDCLDHLGRYLRLLFGHTKRGKQDVHQDNRPSSASGQRRARRVRAGSGAGRRGEVSAPGAHLRIPHQRSAD